MGNKLKEARILLALGDAPDKGTQESSTSLVRLPVELKVVAEGRCTAIELEIYDATKIELLAPDEPDPRLAYRFEGVDGYYIIIFDHRQEVVLAFLNWQAGGSEEDFALVFKESLPCLAGFRLKGPRGGNLAQYIVLANLGHPGMHDSGEEKTLILTRNDIFNSKTHRVMGRSRQAIHNATGICLCEPRPPKGF